MQDIRLIQQLQGKYRHLESLLNERTRRLWAASEALELGHGGISAVARATGLAYGSIRAGLAELKVPPRQQAKASASAQRLRRPGGGRKKSAQKDAQRAQKDAQLVPALLALVEPGARGDPQSPLQWTLKSTRVLARELTRAQHPVSHATVAALLEAAHFSLQANRKTREGKAHPERNAQFEHINAKVRDFLERQEPAISVDTKKKELIGDFKNAGREYRPKGQPEPVRGHDFLDKELGKAIPYGVYELSNNQGWVSVGIDHRYGALRGQHDRALVAGNGRRALSQSARVVNHGGWWRQQQFAQSALEDRLAGAGGSAGVDLDGLSFSAWHQQVEQDRTPALLLHPSALARQARCSRARRSSNSSAARGPRRD